MALLRRHAFFVIGSHQDHGRELKKAGLKVEIVKLGGTSVRRLMGIINLWIERARRDLNLPLPCLTEESVANLIATYGDDLGLIERHFFEVSQYEAGAREAKLGVRLRLLRYEENYLQQ